jgi:lysophospholipase L1-like esterase
MSKASNATSAGSRLGSFVGSLLALGIGLFAALVLLELLLHFYNPFQARIKGNRIVLLTNKQYHIKNDIIPSLDPVVNQTRNSLGFRGPNPPSDLPSKLSIISVGGSTTQCFFLSDDKTWMARLGDRLEKNFRDVWINNAGLDGHSTYGHIVLMEDHVVRVHPKVVLFLVGANDVGRDPNQEFEAENIKSTISFHSPTAFIKSLSPYSEVASMIANLYRSLNAYKEGLIHWKIDLDKQGYIDVPPSEEQKNLAQGASDQYLHGFEERVRKLIAVSRANGIEPVLMTQPILAGAGTDDVTQLDLARIVVSPGHNGKMWWDVLEKYNNVTRRVGREKGVLVIDVAHELPKSSRYFYDFIHYTNAGADAMSGILYNHLCPNLMKKFPAYGRGACGSD